jgi:hypothetical protein
MTKHAWHVAMPHRSKLESPEQLLELANDYFTWSLENPLLEHKVFSFQGAITHGHVKKLRVFTITGLCNHIGISTMTWINYRGYDDFKETVAVIDEAIRRQKFVGAAADLLNPMIISRDLGLAEKQVIQSDVTNINLNADMSTDEMAKNFEDKLRGENAT